MHVVFFTLLFLFLGDYNPLHAQLAGYRDLEPEETFDMTFQDADGKEHSIKEFQGKIVLVNFWAPFCGPCLKEMPSINNLGDTFKAEEVSLITICTDVKFKEQAKSIFYMGDYKNLPLFFDHKNAFASKLKARGIPVTILLNKERKIIGRLDGSTEWDHYENVQLLNDLVSGKNISKSLSFMEKIMAWIKK